MTILGALEKVCSDALTALKLPWTVAAGALPGSPGPCVSIESVTASFDMRTTALTSQRLAIDIVVYGLVRDETESVLPLLKVISESEWQSETLRVIEGHVSSMRIERDEGPQHERWRVVGMIEYRAIVVAN